MRQPSKWIPAVYGGIIIAVLSSVPVLNLINCACCAGVILGGIAAVYFYRKQTDATIPLTMNEGAILGLLAGILGALIGTSISYLLGGMSMEWIQHLAETADNPELDEMLEQMALLLFSKGIIFIRLVLNLIIDSLFGLIGGLIGVSIFGKAQTSLPPPPQP